MRLFVAIHPDAATQAWLAESQRRLRKELQRFAHQLRWTDPENIHLTLAFLGEMPESAPVEQALLACRCSPTELTVGGLGVFPDPRRPNVVWTGVADESGNLARLQSEIAAAMAGFVEPERRRFAPHLTFARVKPGRVAPLGEAVRALSEVWGNAPEPWRVDSFSLMRSQLDSRGARHSVVRVFGG